MDSAFALRYASASDVAELALLDRAVFGELSYPEFVFLQMVEVHPTGLEVVTAAGLIVAYALTARAHDSETAWLLSLGVLASHRQAGLGRQLTARAIERAATGGGGQIRLTVDPGNTAAVRLYQSLGFATLRAETGYFGPGLDRLVMQRPL